MKHCAFTPYIALLTGCAILVGACSGSGPGGPLDHCAVEFCDIESQECIDAIAVGVACLMDRPVVLPEVEFKTRAEVAAQWEAERDVLTPEWAELERRRLDGLALLGLVPRDAPLQRDLNASVDRISGFYHIEHDRITVLTDPVTAQSSEDRFRTMAHELVHALQFARPELHTVWESRNQTVEGSVVIRSMVEGQAVLIADLLWALAKGMNLATLRWSFDRHKTQALEAALADPNAERTAVSDFAYAFGTAFLEPALQQGGAAAVDAHVMDPPTTINAVIAGRDHWLANLSTYKASHHILDDRGIPVLPGRFELGGFSHRGSWYLNAMVHHTGGDVGTIWLPPPLKDVEADVLSWHFAPEAEEVAAVWRVAFSGQHPPEGHCASRSMWGVAAAALAVADAAVPMLHRQLNALITAPSGRGTTRC